MGRHVMEALGKARVVFEDGKVIEVGEPVVKYCPLFDKYRGIKELTPETIRENMEYRINKFGMCSDDRETRMKDFLSFGISELLSMAVSKKLIDAAVIAADGCGTCVLDDPELIQGLGGRISGLCETSPITKVMDDVGRDRVLDPETAEMNSFGGVMKAFAMGYSKVGVTVAFAEDAMAIRDAFGSNVVIMGVHTTGLSRTDSERMFQFCDVITSCASLHLREVAKEKAILQAGNKVPVYAATEFGKEIMEAKLKELGKEPSPIGIDDPPKPLI